MTVRTYRARTQQEAAQLAAADPAAAGHSRVSELWTPPQVWRVWVTPVILIVAGYLLGGVAISGYELLGAALGGVLGIIYVALARPQGSLTVTLD